MPVVKTISLVLSALAFGAFVIATLRGRRRVRKALLDGDVEQSLRHLTASRAVWLLPPAVLGLFAYLALPDTPAAAVESADAERHGTTMAVDELVALDRTLGEELVLLDAEIETSRAEADRLRAELDGVMKRVKAAHTSCDDQMLELAVQLENQALHYDARTDEIDEYYEKKIQQFEIELRFAQEEAKRWRDRWQGAVRQKRGLEVRLQPKGGAPKSGGPQSLGPASAE